MKEPCTVVDAKDAAVADAAALAGGEQFDVAPTAIERVPERDDVAKFEDRAVGFPDGNIDRVAELSMERAVNICIERAIMRILD
ncbi:MAG: hypothetical protein Q4C34_04770 [Bacteroidales bacterium]|nr:hypothetical protein [Bacteroidales bacterium]